LFRNRSLRIRMIIMEQPIQNSSKTLCNLNDFRKAYSGIIKWIPESSLPDWHVGDDHALQTSQGYFALYLLHAFWTRLCRLLTSVSSANATIFCSKSKHWLQLMHLHWAPRSRTLASPCHQDSNGDSLVFQRLLLLSQTTWLSTTTLVVLLHQSLDSIMRQWKHLPRGKCQRRSLQAQGTPWSWVWAGLWADHLLVASFFSFSFYFWMLWKMSYMLCSQSFMHFFTWTWCLLLPLLWKTLPFQLHQSFSSSLGDNKLGASEILNRVIVAEACEANDVVCDGLTLLQRLSHHLHLLGMCSSNIILLECSSSVWVRR